MGSYVDRYNLVANDMCHLANQTNLAHDVNSKQPMD